MKKRSFSRDGNKQPVGVKRTGEISRHILKFQKLVDDM